MKGMNLNGSSSDYLTYKKSKMNPTRVQRVEKRKEKVRRVFKLSLVTFCIMFICVVVFIKKYAKRVDIEYGRHGMETASNNQSAGIADNFSEPYDPDKRTIDKRLMLIQEEENAPSESRVLPQDRDKNEVMNLEHFEKLKSNIEDDIDEEPQKEEPKQAAVPQKPQTANQTSNSNLMPKMPQTAADVPDIDALPQGNFAPIELAPRSNIKVLIGKYPTFDEAKTAQTAMKNSKARIAPFIRRVGNVYSLQIGSYSNMDVARSVAGNYGKEGFDVWIYQQ